ncbi:HTH CENPB-type domain-containing protein [Trichonephila clavipes]|nr:HTH CENPB-type domain-containing protein [Trichonephila clavipes]
MPNFDKDFVINTDQTRCQYQSTFNRTLADKGSKTIFVKRQDTNKLTPTYTAQYARTLSGKLLPKVFVCLQEPMGKHHIQCGFIALPSSKRIHLSRLTSVASNTSMCRRRSKPHKIEIAESKTFLKATGM